ncbi:CcdB family protein [Franconibacter pulveris]|uniref:CcdB family protein n=1 Tax=Franconibacter pulveris TaxID=435910 RepID=UPI000495500F|nr:CcdB family protein [Franconibacter pulveris]
MEQFRVYQNKGAGKQAYPYFINIQHPVANTLRHVLVVPVVDSRLLPAKPLSAKICPVVEIAGRAYVAMTPMMAGVPTKEVGGEVADFTHYRQPLRDAVDFLLNGY